MQILPALRELDACPDGTCWLWPSITQRSYQTAEILASLLETGYSRIVPEYSFLDPRYSPRKFANTMLQACYAVLFLAHDMHDKLERLLHAMCTKYRAFLWLPHLSFQDLYILCPTQTSTSRVLQLWPVTCKPSTAFLPFFCRPCGVIV